jgi:hypothetical protein
MAKREEKEMKFLIGTGFCIWLFIDAIINRNKRKLFETLLRIIISVIATILFFGQFIARLGC